MERKARLSPATDKGAAGDNLFANDGSFMERFKQLQQQQQEKVASDVSSSSRPAASSAPPKPGVILNKRPLDVKSSEGKKPSASVSGGGKLAFSLKQKSKVVVAPVKLGVDDEEEEEEEDVEAGSGEEPVKRQKLGQQDASSLLLQQGVVVPYPPSDPEVKKVADKLASFVAKNGRQFENITRQRNPGDTPFKFLFDIGCSDYKYYEYRLSEEEKVFAETNDSQTSRAAVNAIPRPSSGFQRSPHQHHSNFQTHASALYGSDEDNSSVSRNSNFAVNATTPRSSSGSQSRPHQQPSKYQTPASALYGSDEDNASVGRHSTFGESSGPPTSDPVAMMEYYAKKAAQEERKRPPKYSKDEMPPPASLQVPVKKGHHMGDYIPQDELEKFLSTCNGAAAQKAAEKAKIQADNIGHKLLSRMGWKEGEGLGSDKSGRADPVMAGNVKKDHLGIGAQQPGEVTAEDDIYEQYKKRMMLGYRYRPNPLNNPRKAYY